MAPITLALLTIGLLWGFWAGRIYSPAVAPKLKQQRFLIAVLSGCFVAGWLLSVKFGGHSLWWLIFKFIPGGSAIRVPARFNFVLNILAGVVVCLVLNELQGRKGGAVKAIAWTASFLVLAEQINTAPNHFIRRASENAVHARVQPRPTECRAFFESVPANPERPVYADQVDAMLIAMLDRVPTVNGYSGWNPDEWHLDPTDKAYLQNIRYWVSHKRIRAGLCGLDLRVGSWTPINFEKIPYLLGSLIDFRTGGNAYLYEAEGWGAREEGGSWAVNGKSLLTLDIPKQPTTDLLITLRARAFLPPQHATFEETIRVNGEAVARWSIKEPRLEKRVRVPLSLLHSPHLQIEFLDSDPKSPAELGLSTDTRRLGLAVEALKVVPVSSQSIYLPNSDIDFRWGGNAYLYQAAGWGEPEEGGSWTVNGRSVLQLELPNQPTTDLRLILRAHAFVPPQRPKLEETVSVNGNKLATWSITDPRLEESVRIPRSLLRSRQVRIEFVNSDPRSPAELGLWKDYRRLGLAIEDLTLEAVSAGGPPPP